MNTKEFSGLPQVDIQQYSVTSSGSANTATTLAPPTATVSALTAVGTLASATTSAAHNFQDQQMVTIAGAVQGEYNGDVKITVVDSTHFTYVMSSAPSVLTATGTITASYAAYAQQINFRVAGGTAILVGPNSSANLFSIAAAGQLTYNAPAGFKVKLSDWYLQSTGTSQALIVGFC